MLESNVLKKEGHPDRVGNLILTALAIGRVTLINEAKNLKFALLLRRFYTRLGEWASANFHPCPDNEHKIV